MAIRSAKDSVYDGIGFRRERLSAVNFMVVTFGSPDYLRFFASLPPNDSCTGQDGFLPSVQFQGQKNVGK